VVGILVDRISGTEIRRASVALDPDPGDERMNALAQFLAGENLAPAGIDVLTTRAVTPGGVPAGPEKPSGGGWGGWKWIAGGLGVGALGVGAYLVAIDGRCKVDVMQGMICPDLENSATAGYATLAGGAVVTGISVYLFVRGRGSATRTAFVAPTGGGAVAGLVGRF
jgi:hypothetical protein